MKRLAVMTVAVLAVGCLWAGEQAPAMVVKQAVCPVMGGRINTNLFVDFEGKRIYVCCKGCLPELKQDPAKYVAKLEKDGVTLDKVPAGAK